MTRTISEWDLNQQNRSLLLDEVLREDIVFTLYDGCSLPECVSAECTNDDCDLRCGGEIDDVVMRDDDLVALEIYDRAATSIWTNLPRSSADEIRRFFAALRAVPEFDAVHTETTVRLG